MPLMDFNFRHELIIDTYFTVLKFQKARRQRGMKAVKEKVAMFLYQKT